MEEAYNKVVLVDFPQNWQNLASQIVENIKSCPDKDSLQSPLLILSLVVVFFDRVGEIPSRYGPKKATLDLHD